MPRLAWEGAGGRAAGVSFLSMLDGNGITSKKTKGEEGGGRGGPKLGQIASGTSQVQKEIIDCFTFFFPYFKRLAQIFLGYKNVALQKLPRDGCVAISP